MRATPINREARAVIAVALPCLYAGLFFNDHGQAQNDWIAGVLLAVAVRAAASLLLLL